MHGLVLATVPIWKTGWSRNTCPGYIQYCISTFLCSVNQIFANVVQHRLVVGYWHFGASYPSIFLFLFLFLSFIYFSFYFSFFYFIFSSQHLPFLHLVVSLHFWSSFPSQHPLGNSISFTPPLPFQVLHAPLTLLCTNHNPHIPYTTVHLCIPSILLAILDSWLD